MAAMTKRERVRAALAGEPVDHVPVALWRHDFLLEWSPEELVAATLEAYRADDWDFIKVQPARDLLRRGVGQHLRSACRAAAAPIDCCHDRRSC